MNQAINTSDFTLEVVDNIDKFRALREDWTTTLDKSAQNSLFLSWEWHYSWWECFASSRDLLHIIVLKFNEQIVALAPLYTQRTAFMGTTLRFIGTGEAEADEVVSEYLDFIALPQHEQTCIDCISNWIIEQKNWHRVEFNYILDNYLCVQVAQRLKQNFSLQTHMIGRAFTAPLEASETQYRETRLSASRNKRLKRCLKALDKDGGGLLRKVIDHESEIVTHLDILKTLHDERWSVRNKNSIFESQKFMAFHQKLLGLLIPQKRANIALYLLNDKPICAVYVMYSQADCHYYQSGFTKQGENRYMPLFVSHIMEMNAARESGFEHYDFMRGGTNSYKSDFGCYENDMFDIKIYRYKFESAARSGLRRLRGLRKSYQGKIVTFVKSVKPA